MLYKDEQFNMYIVKCRQKKVQKEIDILILSLQIGKNMADIFFKSFETFLYVDIDEEYCRHTFFI